MKNIFLLLLFSPFYFTSCTKDKKPLYTEVEGYCKDWNTDKPVSDVKINIYWVGKGCDACPPTPGGAVAELFSDANGYYTYKFIAEEGKTYGVNGSKNSECYYYFSPVNSFYLEAGKKNNGDMKDGAFATFRLQLKNIHPFSNSDKISVFSLFGGVLDLPGQSVDVVSNFYGNYGNIKIEVSWEVTKNNIKKIFSDSVFIAPCDTTYFSINY